MSGDPPASPDATRESLLAAATTVFAEQGYEGARVREIAQRAGANAAAISYHFGGKQELYREVLRQQARRRIERYPLAGATPAADPEQALRAALTALLSRFLDEEDSVVPRLLVREMAAPTPALPAMIRDLVAPQFRQLQVIVAQCLGPQADAQTVQRCAFSLVSQCTFYLFARPLVTVLAPQTYAGDAIARLSAHIAEFSIAALRAMRASTTEQQHV